MKLPTAAALLVTLAASVDQASGTVSYSVVGQGWCRDANNNIYSNFGHMDPVISAADCNSWCQQHPSNALVGFEYYGVQEMCRCQMSGNLTYPFPTYNPAATGLQNYTGTGPIVSAGGVSSKKYKCYRYALSPAPTTHQPTTNSPTTTAPVTIAPTTHAPVTSTGSPTTHAPTTTSPTSHAPNTIAPTTHAPVISTATASKSAKGTKSAKGFKRA